MGARGLRARRENDPLPLVGQSLDSDAAALWHERDKARAWLRRELG